MTNKTRALSLINKSINSTIEKIYSLIQPQLLNQTYNLIIGITGGIAVGKTKSSLALKQFLQIHYPECNCIIIPTDSFLMSNQQLVDKDLLNQKGFPATFDWMSLQEVMISLKEKRAIDKDLFLYSQNLKDIDYSHKLNLSIDYTKKNIIIFEGISLLFDYKQDNCTPFEPIKLLDICFYLDSDLPSMQKRARNRLKDSWSLAHNNQINSIYFKKMLDWSKQQVYDHAKYLWQSINLPLIKKHIEPNKYKAHFIINN